MASIISICTTGSASAPPNTLGSFIANSPESYSASTEALGRVADDFSFLGVGLKDGAHLFDDRQQRFQRLFLASRIYFQSHSFLPWDLS